MKQYTPIFEAFHQDELKEQRVYRFSNGYGASVVRGPKTYGGLEGHWELAVIRFYGDAFHQFDVDTTTCITDKVIGDLADHEVNTLLVAISALSVEGALPSA